MSANVTDTRTTRGGRENKTKTDLHISCQGGVHTSQESANSTQAGPPPPPTNHHPSSHLHYCVFGAKRCALGQAQYLCTICSLPVPLPPPPFYPSIPSAFNPTTTPPPLPGLNG